MDPFCHKVEGAPKLQGQTASRIERAIRHAIEVAWDCGDVDTLNRYFGDIAMPRAESPPIQNVSP